MAIIDVDVEDHERFRAEMASIAKDGRRKWVFARQPEGRFYRWRTAVAIVLIVFFVASPFVHIDGHQFMLLNLIDRRFVLFGVPFWPQDLWLLLLLFLTCVVSVAVFTATLGRIWCGWMCPQTIFLEMVFRRIEWWIDGGPKEQARRKGGPWTVDRIRRSVLKHAVYGLLSFGIANVFLSYLISSQTLLQYVKDGPIDHLAVFAPLVLFSVVFYLVFARFREQACVIVCPYGRFMSALVDDNTVTVTYDTDRGEPRGKGKNREQKGDCVDCYQCVTVCPTGIDIRNGIQLECVACTACMDACDDVMRKVGSPEGLIRYSSANGIKSKTTWLTPRIKAYGAVWIVLVSIVTVLFATRPDLEITVLRQEGTTFVRNAEGIINFYRLELINKTASPKNIMMRVVGDNGTTVKPLGALSELRPWHETKTRFIVTVPEHLLRNGLASVDIEFVTDGHIVKRESVRVIGSQSGDGR
jgi:cytochrome c oxidase accessory protein FixG